MAAQKPKILYDNRLKDATPVASSTASGDFNVLNLRDWRRYTWWKPSAIPATVTVDSGISKARDYFLVYGEAGTYEARGSTDNFSASNVLLATIVLSATGLGLTTFASASHRYTRITIPSGAAPAMAIGVIGAALESPVFLEGSFDPLNRKVEGDFNRTNKGHPLGRAIEFEEWSESIKLDLVSWSWVRASFKPAWDAHLRASPFVFAWDAGDHADEIYLVTTKGEFKSPHRSGSRASVSFDVAGVAP